MQPEPTLPTTVAQTATAVALTATSVSGTQQALTNTQSFLTATALALTATAGVFQSAPTPTAIGIVSSVPVVNLGCLGDEQMWFVPRKPNIGVHAQISVTSQRHHDARSMALAGPLDPGPVTEHEGPLGFIWTWTVVPTVEDFYQWTFFADGLRPCITSGFNAFAPLGATPTPTNTPVPTSTPGATATATSQPAPIVTGFTPTSGSCGDPITIFGSNFGTPQNGVQVPTSGQVLFGSRGASIVSWSNGSITIFPAPNSTGGPYTIIVVNSGGSSRAPGQFQLSVPSPATSC
jgi:hypothetical protein